LHLNGKFQNDVQLMHVVLYLAICLVHSEKILFSMATSM